MGQFFPPVKKGKADTIVSPIKKRPPTRSSLSAGGKRFSSSDFKFF
jgi:hypothetical protein